MTEASKMNPFKKRLYDEFEDHAFKILGVSGDRVWEVLGERGHDIDADFEAAFEFAGVVFMRQKMSHILCALELVYHETEIGRELTKDEKLQRFTNWNIGLNMETLNADYYTAIIQQEEEAQQKDVSKNGLTMLKNAHHANHNSVMVIRRR